LNAVPVRFDDPRPPYEQLAAELRAAIHNGDYQPGDRLPPARELAQANGIAVMTVRHAYDVLRDEGLIVGHQGRGVFVQDPGTASPEPDAAAGQPVPDAPTEPESEHESDITSVLDDLDAIRRHLGPDDEATPADLDEAIKLLDEVRARLDAQAAERRGPASDLADDLIRDPGHDPEPDLGL
jgi:DNA-binding transcriptional regulator YhcF (GntR family)